MLQEALFREKGCHFYTPHLIKCLVHGKHWIDKGAKELRKEGKDRGRMGGRDEKI